MDSKERILGRSKRPSVFSQEGQAKVRSRLPEEQEKEFKTFEKNGARIENIYYAGYPGDYSFYFSLAFPKWSTGNEEILFFTKKWNFARKAYEPSSWAVLAPSDEAFIRSLIRKSEPTPLSDTAEMLTNYGFRTHDEIDMETGIVYLGVEFPGYVPGSNFNPNMILQGNLKGRPTGWKVVR